MKKIMLPVFACLMLLGLPSLSHALSFEVYSGTVPKTSAKFIFLNQASGKFESVSFDRKALFKSAKNTMMEITADGSLVGFGGIAFAHLDHCGIWLDGYNTLLTDSTKKTIGHQWIHVEFYSDGTDIGDNQNCSGAGMVWWYDAGADLAINRNKDGRNALLILTNITPWQAGYGSVEGPYGGPAPEANWLWYSIQ